MELKSDYKWDTLLMDIGIHPLTKQFFIRKNFIEDGIKQYVTNSKVEKMLIEHLNIELLDSLTHEQYHIITRERKNHHYPIIYKEHKEDLIWHKVSDLSDRKLEKGDIRYYRYRMVPDEYYAFKYANSRVMRIFSILNRYYGEDENYSKYLEYVFKTESRVINTYKEDFPSCEDITYDEIYQRILEGHIQDFSLKENVSIEEIKRDLSLLPSIFDRKE